MRKVRIKKSGGPIKGPGHRINQIVPAYSPYEMSQPSAPTTTDTLQPVPKDQASLEAEKGETAYVPDVQGLAAHYKIGGNRHSEGGTPLALPDDSFIFSDTRSLKIGGDITKTFGKTSPTKKYTPADLAKQYDINMYRKILADPANQSDPVLIKTAEMMIGNYNKKLGALALTQEALKGFPDGIPQMALPYLMSSAIDPSQVLPLKSPDGQSMPQQGPGQPSLEQAYGGSRHTYDQTGGQYDMGGNAFQNGSNGFGYQTGGAWESASNKNDPAKGYWNRAKMANVFQRENSEDIDPRLTTAVHKLNPFSDEVHGVGDYVKNLLTMPQKEMNHLTTGYYENPVQTLNRYHSPAGMGTKIGIGIGTDPMMWPEAPIALGKVSAKGVATVAPAVGAAAYKYAIQPTAKALMLAGKWAAKYLPKADGALIGKIATRITQAGMHMDDGTTPEDVDKLIKAPVQQLDATSVAPSVQDSSAYMDFVRKNNPDAFPAQAPATPPVNIDSIAKAQGYKQYGGDLIKAQDGLQVENRPDGKGNLVLFVNGVSTGKTKPDPSYKAPATSKPSPKIPAKAQPTDAITNPSWVKAVHDKGYNFNIPQAPGVGIATPAMQTSEGQGQFGQHPWEKDQALQQDFAKRHKWFFDKHPEIKPEEFTSDADANGQSANVGKFQQEYNNLLQSKGLPNYFDTKWGKGFGVDQKLGAHTWAAPDPNMTKPVAQPPAKKPEARKEPQVGYNPQAPVDNAPWWLQDVIQTAGAAGDFLRLKKYLPWGSPVSPVLPETTFYDPTRELAANSEQSAIGAQGADAFSGPQAYASRYSAIQGQGLKNAVDILGKYNNMNVSQADRSAEQRANVMNSVNQYNTGNAKDLYDKTTIANQNFDNSKAQARQELRQSYIQGLTNAAQTQSLNAMHTRDYHVDPTTGGTTEFNPNGVTLHPSSPQSAESIAQRAQDYKSKGWSDEYAYKLALGEDTQALEEAKAASYRARGMYPPGRKSAYPVQSPGYGATAPTYPY